MTNSRKNADQAVGKGKPPKRGGSRKGVPNRIGANIKEMIETALNMVGGEKYLARQAEKNPHAFMALVGKALPLQLHASGGSMILEQLALAAQALRERAALPAPMIDVSPAIDGLDHGNGLGAKDKDKQDQ